MTRHSGMSDGTKIALLSLAGGLLLAVVLLALSSHLAQQSVCAQPAICIVDPGQTGCRAIRETCRGVGLSTQAVIALSAGASLTGAAAAALIRRR